jgi:hypothetical protein
MQSQTSSTPAAATLARLTSPTQTDIRNALYSAEHYINKALFAPLDDQDQAIAEARAKLDAAVALIEDAREAQARLMSKGH